MSIHLYANPETSYRDTPLTTRGGTVLRMESLREEALSLGPAPTTEAPKPEVVKPAEEKVPEPESQPEAEAKPEQAVPPSPSIEEVLRDYVVQPGDTALGIAENAGIDINTLIWANDLPNSDSLKIGQELTVPPIDGVLYSIVEGDTIASIASKFGASPDAIVGYAPNHLVDDDSLSTFQKIIVPGGEKGQLWDPSRPAASTQASTAPQRPAAPALAASTARALASSAPAPAAPAVSPPPPPPPSASGGGVVATAMRYAGYPYVWGGTSPAGFDCSGFMQFVFRQNGIYLSRDIGGMLASGKSVSRANLQPGDIVAFVNTYAPGLTHVGIYIGGGGFISAVTEGKGVRVEDMTSGYWAVRYYAAARF